ncbi:alanine racemase [Litoreibacter arenae]|uniref:Alanine racemase n=1 Tax=Litoreibacter arenae DSM 19593 TaxID=1123360 RepID=S9QCU1_9RHOB|nr:alanine racemase [Litoreibacter arenae]EPX79246.1 Alanine racemase [Litoreibacter arenae DSM 19593]
MATGTLHIDLNALVENWRALDRQSATATGAVVKADGYGLGAGRVARALADAGVRTFFVAVAEEAAAIRASLGPDPVIYVFSGHMEGDAQALSDLGAVPLLNSPEQVARHRTHLPDHPFGLQIDTGMNRLGIEAYDWSPEMSQDAALVMSHLACADEPGHQGNQDQLRAFLDMTAGILAPRSLAATGGILLGPEYHFDMTRPGIGLYGGLPFSGAKQVARLDLPVVQTRRVKAGEAVGYGHAFIAESDRVIATVSAGYADGLIRAMSGKASLFAGDTPCPLAGRVSMDLLTVDVTHLDEVPEHLSILGPHQSVDQLANAASTIGYEILTSLGQRYKRSYS